MPIESKSQSNQHCHHLKVLDLKNMYTQYEVCALFTTKVTSKAKVCAYRQTKTERPLTICNQSFDPGYKKKSLNYFIEVQNNYSYDQVHVHLLSAVNFNKQKLTTLVFCDIFPCFVRRIDLSLYPKMVARC